MKTETLIIGGGLSGLYAAYLLSRQERDFLLIEGRNRLGGRILSEALPSTAGSNTFTAFDLGPTWYWPDHQRMSRLLDELGIENFRQYTNGASRYEDPQRGVESFSNPGQMPPSFRVAGGMARLIDRLAEHIPTERLRLSNRAAGITLQGGHLEVAVRGAAGTEQNIRADRVLMALPPRLAMRSISLEPALPVPVHQALLAIPTWMAGHAKVVAVYDRPFWRDQGLSGHAFSHIGPAMEIHDASQPDGPAALFGFLGVPAQERRKIDPAAVRAAAIAQFERLFGPEAAQPTAIFLKDWIDDPLTATEDDLAPLYNHPEYGLPAAAQHLWDGRLIFCATEAASSYGGYLEGALVAAEAATGKPST
ncbi:FAD-dependent oxidoreductase [Pelagibius sp. Alg239-R121]|uniref:flavin monoamine oxidase family protein n=1 Tax=Pelagibius sp. Alg239-R121 TaxID=2993448 RepID=UPI0024A68EE9|nr:FAD-dependent oxidoreductase [Pelagibius sp. Alg239-R121]